MANFKLSVHTDLVFWHIVSFSYYSTTDEFYDRIHLYLFWQINEDNEIVSNCTAYKFSDIKYGFKYSRFSLSQIPRDSLKYFVISVLDISDLQN